MSAGRIRALVMLGSIGACPAAACQTTVDSVGFNDAVEGGPTISISNLPDAGEADGIAPPAGFDASSVIPDAAPGPDAGPTKAIDASKALSGDAAPTTADANGPGPPPSVITLKRLKPPAKYPNLFGELLQKTDDEITKKIDTLFSQLFYDDETAIYETFGTDEGRIVDTLHDNTVRTEGMSYGMLIAVELDKRDIFDRLWRYSQRRLQYTDGPNRGYFLSACDTNVKETGVDKCIDPFGLEQFTMALIFAHDRWDGDAGSAYEADAVSLLNLMLHKEEQNGGIVNEVTNTFDNETQLVFHEPKVAASTFTRPAVEMPAYYELWAQATGNAFWSNAAASARKFWASCANADTGLMPVRAYFEGTPVVGWTGFWPEGYRVHLNIVLDYVWTGAHAWENEESNKLLQFFASKGLGTYGKAYSLDGETCLDTFHESSLVAVNGALALSASTSVPRRDFVSAVWNLELTVPEARYYSGLLQLVSMLTLAGRMRVL